jgi:hypothetical protein
MAHPLPAGLPGLGGARSITRLTVRSGEPVAKAQPDT